MSKWTDNELETLLETVVRRTAVDPEFRTLAVSNPIAAIQKFANKPVPNIDIRFVDKEGPGKVLILPPLVPQAGELSQAELEHVAGGVEGCTVTCACTESCCYTCQVTNPAPDEM